jgi:hypothetical protein
MKTGSRFVAYLPSFNGNDTLLILVDDETIDWLISQFDRLSSGPSFVIGDGNPIESDGKCLIQVEQGGPAEGSELVRASEHCFKWSVSTSAAEHYRQVLSGMLETRPGHQYLDPDNCPAAPVVIVSRGEYDADWVRRMKLRNEAK